MNARSCRLTRADTPVVRKIDSVGVRGKPPHGRCLLKRHGGWIILVKSCMLVKNECACERCGQLILVWGIGGVVTKVSLRGGAAARTSHNRSSPHFFPLRKRTSAKPPTYRGYCARQTTRYYIPLQCLPSHTMILIYSAYCFNHVADWRMSSYGRKPR